MIFVCLHKKLAYIELMLQMILIVHMDVECETKGKEAVYLDDIVIMRSWINL
jgi:hypothetical protein